MPFRLITIQRLEHDLTSFQGIEWYSAMGQKNVQSYAPYWGITDTTGPLSTTCRGYSLPWQLMDSTDDNGLHMNSIVMFCSMLCVYTFFYNYNLYKASHVKLHKVVFFHRKIWSTTTQLNVLCEISDIMYYYERNCLGLKISNKNIVFGKRIEKEVWFPLQLLLADNFLSGTYLWLRWQLSCVNSHQTLLHCLTASHFCSHVRCVTFLIWPILPANYIPQGEPNNWLHNCDNI